MQLGAGSENEGEMGQRRHQEEDPWLHLCRKTRFGEMKRKRRRKAEREMGKKEKCECESGSGKKERECSF
jgi:hypothetical protein